MYDNPQPVSGADFALSDHRVLELSGRDAAVFAQAQFMNDVAALADGAWQWNGWLTPKGRLVALFALVRFDPERLWLLLPDADPAALATALQRFVFRSRLAITPRLDLHASGTMRAPADAAMARWSGDADAGIELDLSGDGQARSLRIAVDTAPEQPASASHWKAVDLEHGLPRLLPSQAEQWTPQQLSLDRLNAYSVKKGCYPGQEIVARTHFLGQAKRGLALFEADAPITAGSDVRVADATWGSIVSGVSDGNAHLALAVGGIDTMPAEASCDGVPIRAGALRAGLAR
jgi:folate-binding protein YgfZ